MSVGSIGGDCGYERVNKATVELDKVSGHDSANPNIPVLMSSDKPSRFLGSVVWQAGFDQGSFV